MSDIEDVAIDLIDAYCDKHGWIPAPYMLLNLSQRIKIVLAAERERCAGIAESFISNRRSVDSNEEFGNDASYIARAIRKGITVSQTEPTPPSET